MRRGKATNKSNGFRSLKIKEMICFCLQLATWSHLIDIMTMLGSFIVIISSLLIVGSSGLLQSLKTTRITAWKTGSRLHAQNARNRQERLMMAGSKLIVGLNKYSHDASCAIIDSSSGKVLFSQAKERLTGRKHDGGGIGKSES